LLIRNTAFDLVYQSVTLNSTRMFHPMEAFMVKAFRSDVVVKLLRASNNDGHGSVRWA